MARKLIAGMAALVTMFSLSGCCAWCDRWCSHHNTTQAYAPAYAPQACCQPCCTPCAPAYQAQPQRVNWSSPVNNLQANNCCPP